jgi:hypothetical protein
VLYAAVDDVLWINTMRTSRKARSIATNPHVAVCIPFRKLPVGPPYTVHFQATASLVPAGDPELHRLADAGLLKTITGHGELEDPDAVFLRVEPAGPVHSYGLGVNPIELVRDPLHTGARTVELRQP